VKHIIGEGQRGTANTGTSYLYALLDVFSKHTDARTLDDGRYPAELDLELAWEVAASFRAPTQKLEFLARNHLFGQVAGKNVLLGTPFYVALAD
jgi:uncharacterized protein DUF7019